MGVIADVINGVKQALQFTSKAGDVISKGSNKSFAKGASEQTFFFPCLIASSAPVPMSSTIVRYLDRTYAAFVQIYLSANGIIDLNYIRNPRQFINQYQSQFSLESGEEDDEELQEILEDYRDLTYAGNALFVDPKTNNMLLFQEGEMSLKMRKNFQDGLCTIDQLYNTRNIPVYMEDNRDVRGDIVNAWLDAKDKALDKDTIDATSKASSPKMLNEKEVKKMNDMQPYVLELKLLATKGDSSLAQYVNFNVGVKTTLHLGKSEVLTQNLVYVLKNKNPLFNFIRWTTGEISLLKDIVLNLSDINFNVVNKYDATGKFITALKRMKKRPLKINRSGLSHTTPMATIVITSYEYNTILNENGFDLKNITFAKKIMDELYLMAFVIMDEATQTVDVLLDGSTSGFQTYSLDMLERETTMNSSKLGKELTKMLGAN